MPPIQTRMNIRNEQEFGMLLCTAEHTGRHRAAAPRPLSAKTGAHRIPSPPKTLQLPKGTGLSLSQGARRRTPLPGHFSLEDFGAERRRVCAETQTSPLRADMCFLLTSSGQRGSIHTLGSFVKYISHAINPLARMHRSNYCVFFLCHHKKVLVSLSK